MNEASKGNEILVIEDHDSDVKVNKTAPICRLKITERKCRTVPDTPPVIRLPCCPVPYNNIELKTLNSEDVEVITEVERSKQVVAKLQREKIVVMAAEGVNIGKEGPLTLIQIGTYSGFVFVFDILMNRDLVGKGRLRVLLEDDKVMKVMHDCSSVSAALTFQCATTLRNVFDTQIAHLVIEEHKGRRLPSGLKVSDICLQYSDKCEKFYTYDWRTNSKVIWMATMGNFWAMRPLTRNMLELAVGDILVLIPDVYMHQSEYIDENGLREKLMNRVGEWLQIEIDDIVKEHHGKRVAKTVDGLLYKIDTKYDDRATLLNILDPDEINALAIATYEDAVRVSERVRKLKIEHILSDISEIELSMRTDVESWEKRDNVLNYLRYCMRIADTDVREKAMETLKEMLRSIFEHIEDKYIAETTTGMLSSIEKEGLLTISYLDIVKCKWGPVITSIYWRLMQEELHGMINFLRLYPTQFSLTDGEYSKVVYYARNPEVVPDEVSSLANGLLHALRAYSAATGGYAIDARRRTGAF